MSRIYFHSEHAEAEVRGTERFYADHICRSLFFAVLDLTSDWTAHTEYLKILSPDSYMHGVRRDDARSFNQTLRTHLSASIDKDLWLNGRPVSIFGLVLNTAYRLGSDPVKLLARLHGQCEIHAYVEGHDRAWLADIVEQGQSIGVMRADSGWESVVALLRARDDGPVVTSYSACDQFPNRQVSTWKPSDGAAWYDLPWEEQWRMSMEALRTNGGLRLMPDNWSRFFFDEGLTAFDVLEHLAAAEQPPAAV